MADVKLYKLQVTGQTLDERIAQVNANMDEIARNFAEDAAFRTEVASTYATKAEVEADYQPKGDYLTEHQSLENYATKAEIPTVPTAVSAFENDANYLTSHQSLTDYATKTFVEEKISEVVGEAPATLDTLKEIADALEDSATMTQVAEAIATKANAADVYTKGEIDNAGFLTEHQSLEDYATKAELPSVEGLLSEADAAETYQPKGEYLTEHQSLAGYATETYVNEKIAEATVGGEVDLEAYATKEFVSENYQPKGEYLTEHQSLEGLLSAADAAETYQPKGEYLTEHQSLADYALSTDVDAVNDRIDTILADAPEELDTLKEIADLLAEKQDAAAVVEALASKANVSDIPDVSNFITMEDVEAQGYLTEHQSLEDYALKSELPSVEGLLSEADAAETYQPKGEYLTEHQSLAGYATTSDVDAVNDRIDTILADAPEELDTLKEIADLLEEKQDAAAVVEALASKANVSDIPDVSNFITMEDVEAQGYLTEHQSLEDYALKSELPDLTDYIDESSLDSKLGSFSVEASDEYWTMNGEEYDADPTYEVSNNFDYVYDADSWQESYENGGLALYYANNPFEDLWNGERIATITDRVCDFISYSDENGENEYATGKVQELVNNPWNDAITYIKVKVIENSVEGFIGNEYYIVKNAEVGETLYQLYTDSALTQGTGIYVKITSETVPGFNHSWEGAINAPGAMYPWIVPHFDNDEVDANAKLIFRYEGKEDVYPWGDRIFGNGNNHKVWGCASVPGELGNEFLLTDGETTFDINKFQLVLEHQGVEYYPAVEAAEYTVKEYIDMKFQQLYEMLQA